MTTLALTGIRVRAAKSGKLRALRRNKLAMTGAVIAVVFVLAALFAPLVAPYDPAQPNFDNVLAAPGWSHWLGTDDLGRDQLSRVVYGARASMQVGVLAVVFAFIIGVPLGLLAGYYGKLADSVVSRVTDTMLAFPFLVLAVGLAAVLGPSLTNATIAIGISQIPAVIRITRAETLRLKHVDYVAAAVANGEGTAPSCSATSCPTRPRRSSSRPPSASPPRSSARPCSASSASASSRPSRPSA